MAASINIALRTANNLKPLYPCRCFVRNASWTSFFRKSQSKDEGQEVKEQKPPKQVIGPASTTMSGLKTLKKKTSVYNVRGYQPPADVETKVTSIAESLVGEPVLPSYQLDDRVIKFKLLTRLMEEFDHIIPNTELSTMNTVEDVITYFSTPVRDRSVYEDMAKLNLPKNLHIQMEPLRFDPDTDTFFDGKTAFPGRPTVISSLKYSRKYKGNSGESRNERSRTNFEMRGNR